MINFLPNLSPSVPHIGVIKKETIKGPEKIIPLHLATLASSLTPSSRIKKGRNGTIILIPIIVMNCAIQTM